MEADAAMHVKSENAIPSCDMCEIGTCSFAPASHLFRDVCVRGMGAGLKESRLTIGFWVEAHSPGNVAKVDMRSLVHL